MGLTVKHQQLARQVGDFADDHRRNSMASPDNSDSVLAKGTTITFGSWVLIADGSGGFDSHLVDPNAPGSSKSTRRRVADEFVDHLNKIPLHADVKKSKNNLILTQLSLLPKHPPSWKRTWTVY